MFALANYSAMAPIIFPALISLFSELFTLFTLVAFDKYKNLILETLGLATDNYITINNVFII